MVTVVIFKREKQLQEKLLDLVKDLVSEKTYAFVRREVPVGGYIPDMIIVQFHSDPSEVLSINNWSFRHAYIVWLLKSENKLTFQSIAERCYESAERISPIIESLLQGNVIQKVGKNHISLCQEVLAMQAEVIAVEAKLKHWRRALEQAIRYKSFANRVFVAMDCVGVPRKQKVLDEFRNNDVGLCAISKQDLEWLVESVSISSGSISPEQEYLVASAVISTRQTLWSRRNPVKASYHA